MNKPIITCWVIKKHEDTWKCILQVDGSTDYHFLLVFTKYVFLQCKLLYIVVYVKQIPAWNTSSIINVSFWASTCARRLDGLVASACSILSFNLAFHWQLLAGGCWKTQLFRCLKGENVIHRMPTLYLKILFRKYRIILLLFLNSFITSSPSLVNRIILGLCWCYYSFGWFSFDNKWFMQYFAEPSSIIISLPIRVHIFHIFTFYIFIESKRKTQQQNKTMWNIISCHHGLPDSIGKGS